jgi:L-seryl-tRNA(Ser) seleniumtransferase
MVHDDAEQVDRHDAEQVGPDPRRRVPHTMTVLADPDLQLAEARLGRGLVRAAVRAALDRARRGEIEPTEVAGVALAALPRHPGGLVRVINATGVLLHTNLGRAPLSAASLAALTDAAACTDVEFDLSAGRRASRGRTVLEALRAAVPDAEDALVVNNNAAALVLVATALAAGREIVVSRGELVEIGDGFRLPELLESTGARLREVGTTNRTSFEDYRRAVGPETALVLKVHPSNFTMQGFTSSVGVVELAALPVPVVIDIGSGLLRPEPALPEEPDAATHLRAGAALVTASTDKLLGGPQGGLILGRSELVAGLRRHPLARALRIDKLTVAALGATLLGPQTPTAASLRADPGELRRRGERLLAALIDAGLDRDLDLVRSDATVGAGGAPGVLLPSVALALPARLAAPLRTGQPPVVGRVEGGRCLLDLRSVAPEDDSVLADAVVRAARGL